MIGDSQAYRLESCGGDTRYDRGFLEDESECSWPEYICESVGNSWDIDRILLEIEYVSNMDDERIVSGSSLCLEYPPHRTLIECVGAESVDGLSRERDESTTAYDLARSLSIVSCEYLCMHGERIVKSEKESRDREFLLFYDDSCRMNPWTN
jgi:hypothetical protein